MFSKKPSSAGPYDLVPSSSPPLAAIAEPMQRAAPPPPANGSSQSMSSNDSDGVVIIGKGTRIVGEITDCSRLEIQGVVDGTIVADVLIIRDGGSVKGRLQATRAEVHGLFNGQLEIAEVLDVRSTGRVEGELAYGKLAVAMGGHISGSVTNPNLQAAAAGATAAAAPPPKADTVLVPSATGYAGAKGANGSVAHN